MRIVSLLLLLLGTVLLDACSVDDPDPPGTPPAVAGTYDLSGETRNLPLQGFDFNGVLVLTQSDPSSGVFEGTLTLDYSNEWPDAAFTIYNTSVEADGAIQFWSDGPVVATVWSGSFTGTAIVEGRFLGYDPIGGVWDGTRRP